MKALIVTIQSENYGNRLQNYALQKKLIELGYDVENLQTNELGRKARFIKYTELIIDKILMKNKKNHTWYKFNKKFVFRKFSNGSNYDDFDVLIAGSDQIWNPNFQLNEDLMFLGFHGNGKRIAYAGSFGVSSISDSNNPKYSQLLSNFDSISTREDAGSKIVKDLTGKVVPVVLDPTMLLSKNDWINLSNESKIMIKEKFIVRYFLGSTDSDYNIKIEEYAKKNNFKIVDIFNSHEFTNKIGPTEFVWLLANSEFNFVDSFHGGVFSILFNNKFFIFDRPSEEWTGDMNSRMDTLLSTFELEDKLIRNYSEFSIENSMYDYANVERILMKKRKEAMKFLSSIQNM